MEAIQCSRRNKVLNEHNIQQPRYTVRPRQLDIYRLPYNMFGDSIGEHAANLIVKLCYPGDLWRPFTKEELTELNNQAYQRRQCISLGSLCPADDECNPSNLIVKSDDGKYHATTAFADMYNAFAPIKKAA